MLFNKNSIHHLNQSRPIVYEKFNRLRERYKSGILDNGLNPEHFCITGSAVLSAYGLREGADLDYLHHGSVVFNDPENLINSHNRYGVGLYDLPYDEIIFNPENHFYSGRLKFASLDIVKRLKIRRKENKDVTDVALITVLDEFSGELSAII
jgi:hypothetical protein